MTQNTPYPSVSEQLVKEIMQEGFDVAMGGSPFKNEEENKEEQDRLYEEVVTKYRKKIDTMIHSAQEQAVGEERKRILDILKNWGSLVSLTPIPNKKPTHGNCCTCQTCGYYQDECVCETNELLKLILPPERTA